jgi:hypothetical protein
MATPRGGPQFIASPKVSDNGLSVALAKGLRWPEDILQPYREQDEGPALRFAHRIMDAAVDNLRGVAVLMGDDRLDRPPVALSRVVLDAAAHLHHVLKPGLDPEERIVRVLNESLARAGEDFRAAMREQAQERHDEAPEQITAILDAVGARRQTHWNRGRGSLPFIGEKAALHIQDDRRPARRRQHVERPVWSRPQQRGRRLAHHARAYARHRKTLAKSNSSPCTRWALS